MRRPGRPARPARPVSGAGPERFKEVDAYRADREWKRYEGTPQRDLFRELRERFLARYAVRAGWAIDVGCGPGRFLGALGGGAVRQVGLDLSYEMLRAARLRLRGQGTTSALVIADARCPPVRPRAAQLVAVLGNTIGFAGPNSAKVLAQSAELVGPGGHLLLETAPGNGERSRYLARLPPGAVRRLLSAPVNLVRARIEREGFVPELRAPSRSGFQRLSPEQVHRQLTAAGFAVREMTAVAPALGPDAVRIAAVRTDPAAWSRLLEVEEAVGRAPGRWSAASALLVAAQRSSG